MDASPPVPPADDSGAPKPSSVPESKDTIEQTKLGDPNLQHVHAQLLREKPEPEEGFSPVPLILIFLFAGLSFWGGVYIIEFGGAFDPLVYDETLDTSAPVEAPAPLPLIERGAIVYSRQCVACHQATGMGAPGAFPPLVGSEWVVGSEERVIKILLHGLQGEIVVLGNTYNGAMPPFSSTLRTRDIAAVLTYIRGTWGNTASEITEEQVAAVFEEFGDRSPWDGDELLGLHPME